MSEDLAYGKPITVTPTKKQRIAILELQEKASDYKLALDIRKNYLDEILKKAKDDNI